MRRIQWVEPAVIVVGTRYGGRRGSAIKGALVSLAFWCSLILAAALFAMASLAPKLVTRETLSRQFQQQQSRLLELELQTEQLGRVVTALELDPEFAAEIARLEFDAMRPGEEVIAVDAALQLTPVSRHAASSPRPADEEHSWQPRVNQFAADAQLRQGLLVVAAILVVVAFTFLQDNGGDDAEHGRAGRTGRWARVTARYRGQ